MHESIAVCSWSLRPTGPVDLVARLEDLGVAAVQLALGPLLDGAPGWENAIDAVRSAGIEIVSAMLAFPGEDYSTLETIRRSGGLRPDETWPANRSRAETAARLAGEHSIDLVSFHAGFLPPRRDDPLRPAMLERLGAVADVFGDHGVGIALETGQETAATLAAVLGELSRPAVGVNFDPANMILYGMGDPVEALRDLAAHVRQVHVKDARPAERPGTWGTEVPAGRGAVDWDAFFDVARHLAPPVRFVIERESEDDRAGDIALARDLIARRLAERTEDDRHAPSKSR